jgi:hypothetical protein
MRNQPLQPMARIYMIVFLYPKLILILQPQKTQTKNNQCSGIG